MRNDNVAAACLTLTQLMQRWQCSRKVILAAVEREELAVFRVGNRAYRVLLSEVERYEHHRVEAAS